MSTLVLVLYRFHLESINPWMYLDYPLVPFSLPALRAQHPGTPALPPAFVIFMDVGEAKFRIEQRHEER